MYSCSFFNIMGNLGKYIYFQLSSVIVVNYSLNLTCLYLSSSRIFNSPFLRYVYNYYMSDVYSLNSKTLLLCARKSHNVLFTKIINLFN